MQKTLIPHCPDLKAKVKNMVLSGMIRIFPQKARKSTYFRFIRQ
jgi:hypothetical protein